jgi:hypothetical protein
VPYIITTRLVEGDPEAPRSADVTDRRAVATLDEARGAAQEAVDSAGPIKSRHSWEAICGYIAHTMGEEGGTVGPLPDGTVIAVERTGWDRLRDAIGQPTLTVCAFNADNRDAILDAYNAEGSNR